MASDTARVRARLDEARRQQRELLGGEVGGVGRYWAGHGRVGGVGWGRAGQGGAGAGYRVGGLADGWRNGCEIRAGQADTVQHGLGLGGSGWRGEGWSRVMTHQVVWAAGVR